jgi:hypothetical protein
MSDAEKIALIAGAVIIAMVTIGIPLYALIMTGLAMRWGVTG